MRTLLLLIALSVLGYTFVCHFDDMSWWFGSLGLLIFSLFPIVSIWIMAIFGVFAFMVMNGIV